MKRKILKITKKEALSRYKLLPDSEQHLLTPDGRVLSVAYGDVRELSLMDGRKASYLCVDGRKRCLGIKGLLWSLYGISRPECEGCGLYLPGKRRYCDQCSRKGKARKKALRKLGKSLRREVLERDRYKCYLCGKKTDQSDQSIDENGHYHTGPAYPTVDHVIPLADGGEHAIENMACACMECNSVKKDRVLTLC